MVKALSAWMRVVSAIEAVDSSEAARTKIRDGLKSRRDLKIVRWPPHPFLIAGDGEEMS